MEKKSSKEYSVVFLVEGEKFNLGEKVQAKSSNLPRRFCSNSVGTPLEQNFHADRQLVTKKEISIKINCK